MSCFSFPKINTQRVLGQEGPPGSFGMSPSFLREKARIKRGPVQSRTEGIEKKGLEPGSPGSKLRALPYRLASPRHQNACLVPTPLAGTETSRGERGGQCGLIWPSSSRLNGLCQPCPPLTFLLFQG